MGTGGLTIQRIKSWSSANFHSHVAGSGTSILHVCWLFSRQQPGSLLLQYAVSDSPDLSVVCCHKDVMLKTDLAVVCCHKDVMLKTDLAVVCRHKDVMLKTD